VAIAAITLATVGAGIGFLSGASPTRSALRMLGLAAIAAAVTVAVGRLVGARLD
jgi:VIT1/CCC1 family predicted Fe2+/Mn2+ transporter